ncbi:ATP-binding protein [bacterium]|jgi:predicted AAA+ superfamily ATPase|nr:ATP-binding protein [bacterium]
MPHERKRHIEELIRKTLAYSPIAGILGHRQVGKTTLAQVFSERYTTLDAAESLASAQSDATAFLLRNEAHPLVIDECQLAPPLFPALKEWVRTRKRPGQFLLTGSVRFTSRKAIRESLTGRIVTWELLPMDWAEQHEQALSAALPNLLKSLSAKLPVNPSFSRKAYLQAIESGGLPGVFSVRNPGIRAQRFETQINTILERDLRLLIQTSLPYSTLRRILEILASQSGGPLNLSEIHRKTRVSMPTLRKLIPHLESLFLIRLLPTRGDFKSPTVFFEDIGELRHLLNAPATDPRFFTGFLYHHLRTQFHYRSELRHQVFCFRAKSGATAPVCFETEKGILALVPVITGTEDALFHAKAVLKTYRSAKVLLVELLDEVDQQVTGQIRRIHIGRLL